MNNETFKECCISYKYTLLAFNGDCVLIRYASFLKLQISIAVSLALFFIVYSVFFAGRIVANIKLLGCHV